MGAFFKSVSPIHMPGHQRHILQMTFAALIAHGAIVRMIDHQPFNDTLSEFHRIRVIDRNPYAVRRRRHARHYDFAFGIVFILELLYRTHPARPHRMHRRMPAEIRNIKPQRQARMQQVLPRLHFVRFVFYINYRHLLSPRTSMFGNMLFKIFAKIFQCASQAGPSPPAQAHKMYVRGQEARYVLAEYQISLSLPCRLHCLQEFSQSMAILPGTVCTSRRIRGQKISQIIHHAHRTSLIVENDHCAGSEPAADFRIEPKSICISRCSSIRKSVDAPPGSNPRNSIPSCIPPAYSSSISRIGCPHRQFPEARPFHSSACAVNFVPPSSVGSAFEPLRPVVNYMRHIASGFDIIDNCRLAPQPAGSA